MIISLSVMHDVVWVRPDSRVLLVVCKRIMGRVRGRAIDKQQRKDVRLPPTISDLAFAFARRMDDDFLHQLAMCPTEFPNPGGSNGQPHSFYSACMDARRRLRGRRF